MKKIGLFLLAVVMMAGLAGCSSDDSNDNPLVGTWTAQMGAERPGDPDVTVVLRMKDNNTFTSTVNGAASDSGTWSTDGNVLTVRGQDGLTETYIYSVNGNLLTLITSDGMIVLTRV